MPGAITFIAAALMMLGGFAEVVTASEMTHTTAVPGTIVFVGGLILMALGRVIYVLVGIRDALKSAKAEEYCGLQDAPKSRFHDKLPIPRKES